MLNHHCAPLCKVQWVQVVFDVSKPGLSGPANPASAVFRRAQNGSLEMILPGVSVAEMTKKKRRRL